MAKKGRRRSYSRRRRRGGGGRSKGLFGTGLPKAGDMVQAAFGAEKLGGFDALGALTDPTDMTAGTRLTNAYQAVRAKVANVNALVDTVIGLTIINVGLKVSRKVGGKWVRKWL